MNSTDLDPTDTFPTGAMCAVCGWSCDPGDTVDVADRDHAAFDPAHEPLWHAED